MRDIAMVQSALHLDVGAYVPLTSDMHPRAAAKSFLAANLLKKFQSNDPSSVKTRYERALNGFLEDNRLCSLERPVSKSWLDDYIIGEWSYLFDKLVAPDGVNELDLAFIASHMDVGPGSNVGADSRCFLTKLFASELTTTSEHLVRLYRAAISDTSYWADAERQRNDKLGFRIVGGNTFFTVLKNDEIDRPCCTEPTLNILFQKGIGGFLEERLERYYRISLETQQDFNRELARLSSITRSKGTIDLKSASNSIGLGLCELMPRGFSSWIKISRSPLMTLPVSGEQTELRMVSSMGNGFTFPLQTAIFTCLVHACYRLMNIPMRRNRGSFPGNFGVFGDDIIVEKSAYDLVIHALQLFGFTVNDKKSFNTGCFRESCGEDWFNGTNIRSVYIESLDDTADVYSACNRLIRWSAIHGVPLPNLITLMREWAVFRPIPFAAGDDEGFKVPYRVAHPYIKNCGNGILKYKAYVTRSARLLWSKDLDTHRSDDNKTHPTDRRSDLNRFLSDYLPEESAVVALIAGRLRTPECSVGGNRRFDELHYESGLRRPSSSPARRKVKLRETHYWDYMPPAGPRESGTLGSSWYSTSAAYFQ